MLSLSKHEEVHLILDGPTSPCLLVRLAMTRDFLMLSLSKHEEASFTFEVP